MYAHKAKKETKKNKRAQKIVFIRHNLHFCYEPSRVHSTLAESVLELESDSTSNANNSSDNVQVE